MNNNIIKALSCLIGSNCLVSTPEAFYIGERGWLSEAIRIKALEEKTNMMQVDIAVLKSDRDEILGRLSTTENTAINAQSLGENNFDSILILQGLHSETQLLVDNNSKSITNLESFKSNVTTQLNNINQELNDHYLLLQGYAYNISSLQEELESINSQVTKNKTDIEQIKQDVTNTATTGLPVISLSEGVEYRVKSSTGEYYYGYITRILSLSGGKYYSTAGCVSISLGGNITAVQDPATRYYKETMNGIQEIS